MDYNKIREELKNRHINQKKFLVDTINMTVPGFNYACENGTLKIKDLESISEALKLDISYWFINTPLMVHDAPGEYQKRSEADNFTPIMIDKLEKEIEFYVKENELLKEHIESLRLNVELLKSKCSTPNQDEQKERKVG